MKALAKTENERQYLNLWLGQLISSLGSSISSFGLMLWLYDRTGSSSVLGFLMFAYVGPQIYFSLFAGHLIDRFPRQRVLWVSDLVQFLGSGLLLTTIAVFSAAAPVWLILVLIGINGIFSAVQNLIFLTSTTLFVEKDRILHFNGISQIFQGISGVVAPLLAFPLLKALGINTLLVLDFASFLLALLILARVRFPQLEIPARRKFSWDKTIEGLSQIRTNPRLLASLSFFTVNNFLAGLCAGLTTAFIIEKVGKDSPWVAYNSSLTALGLVIGGLTLTKFSKRIAAPFLAIAVTVFVSALLGRLGVAVISAGATVGIFFLIRNSLIPIMNGCNDTIWQQEVPLEMQGRVFGARRTIAQGFYPLGLLLGPVILTYTGATMNDFFLGAGIFEALSPLLLIKVLERTETEMFSEGP